MRVSMNRFGQVVAAGEGSYNKPCEVEQRMHTLGNPEAVAEQMRSEERRGIQMARAKDEARAKVYRARKAMAKKAMGEAQELSDYQKQMSNESADFGENQKLLALAAGQTLNGGLMSEFEMGISGYGLSIDGRPALDRGLGFSWGDVTSTIQNVQSVIENPSEIIEMVTEAATPDAPAPTPSVVQVSAAAKPAGSSIVAVAKPAVAASAGIMSQKIAGIPVVTILGVAGGLVLMLAMKSKSA